MAWYLVNHRDIFTFNLTILQPEFDYIAPHYIISGAQLLFSPMVTG